MFMCPHVARIATLRNDSRVGPDSTVGVELVETVCFVVIFALTTLETGVRLCTYTDSLSGFNKSYFGTDAEGFAYNF